MKKYNYLSRVSGWGICMLFLLTGLFAGCSENEEVYQKVFVPSDRPLRFRNNRQRAL